MGLPCCRGLNKYDIVVPYAIISDASDIIENGIGISWNLGVMYCR